MAVIYVHSGINSGQKLPLSKAVTVIGRRADCDIVLEPNGVSREHAKILREGERFLLLDLNSRNRTKLNEKLVDPGQGIPLKAGDRINICDVELVFYFEEPPENAGPEVEEGDTSSTIQLLDASRSDLMASVVRPEVKLKAILEISRSLTSNLSIESVAPVILDSLMNLYQEAERAFLVLLKYDTPQKWSFDKTFHKIRPPKRSGPRFALGSNPVDEPRMRIARAIINHVVDHKKSVLSQDAGEDKNLPTSASIADLRIRSVMCVPLLASDGKILGILQLDTSDRKQFNQEDLDVLDAVARQAAIALQNASMHEMILKNAVIVRDLELAQSIQKRFLPESVPQVSGYEFFAHYQSAFQVGGDYYDFVPLGSDQMAVALGDVSGKGVTAALLMAKFSGDTRASIMAEREPAAAATRTNRLLCEAGIDDKFITLSLAVLDLPSRRLIYASAGHEPILVRRADGRIEEFGDTVRKFPLGVEVSTEYEQAEVTLAPGDVVVIYSDGVIDARSPSEERYDSLEHRRLRHRVGELGGGPTAVGKGILQELREFCQNHTQADDITLVCFGPTG
jgi:serine phosphatase RsbU (regulator of sigma subunit)/pSer/pThr/pTyr-binding forkhead associated (FHA) protein